MSTTIALHDPSILARSGLTYRDARYISARLAGKSIHDSAVHAGFTGWMVRDASRIVETVEIKAEIERLRGELIAHTLDAGLVDTAELHQYASDALRSDISDIKNPDHSFKPLDEWPLIWRQMAEGGDLEIETASERSHDGATRDKAGGWDVTGQVTRVKYKFGSKRRWAEFLAKLKPVDALVQPAQPDINVSISISAERQRQVAGARKRLSKVIDLAPVSSIYKDAAPKDGDH